MALSKEFYLDEIRSKYPNSYNEGLKDLPVKDLEDMLDFLDQALGKADGGAIGIEVLFTDKKPRKNFFMGGPALEGQALSIYNSMNAYGFNDQEIADALSARGLYTAPGSGTGTETTQSNIIGAQLDQGGGGGGITELQETFTRAAGSTPKFSEDAFFGLGKFLQGKERGTLGTRLANQPRLPLPGAIAAYTRSPFNPDSPTYNPDFVDQLNFLELEDDMIGMSGTGLKYGSGSVLRGQNVISGFGSNNYLKQLNKYINRKNITDKARQKGIDERNAFLAKQKAKQEAAFQNQLNQQQRDQRQRDLSTIEQAYRDFAASRDDSYSSGSAGVQSDGSYNDPFDPGGGEKDGGFIDGYNRRKYSQGGLATMFTRRR